MNAKTWMVEIAQCWTNIFAQIAESLGFCNSTSIIFRVISLCKCWYLTAIKKFISAVNCAKGDFRRIFTVRVFFPSERTHTTNLSCTKLKIKWRNPTYLVRMLFWQNLCTKFCPIPTQLFKNNIWAVCFCGGGAVWARDADCSRDWEGQTFTKYACKIINGSTKCGRIRDDEHYETEGDSVSVFQMAFANCSRGTR